MPPRNFTDAEEEQIAKIYLAGHSCKAIARAYGKNHHISIVAALRRQGVKQRPKPERNRLYALNPHVFDVIDNEAAAYWWGFLYADGFIAGARPSLVVVLKQADRAHLVKLRRFLQSESPIKNIDRNGYGAAHIEFTDRHLARRLRDLGIVVRRTRPRRVFDNLPPELYEHWIRGYFDGDGSARRDGSIAICGSRTLLQWIRATMAEHADTNPDLAITKHTISDIYYIYFSGRNVAHSVAEYMYRNATVFLARKMDVIDNWQNPEPRSRDEKGRYI